MYKEDGYV